MLRSWPPWCRNVHSVWGTEIIADRSGKGISGASIIHAGARAWTSARPTAPFEGLKTRGPCFKTKPRLRAMCDGVVRRRCASLLIGAIQVQLWVHQCEAIWTGFKQKTFIHLSSWINSSLFTVSSVLLCFLHNKHNDLHYLESSRLIRHLKGTINLF